MTTVAGSLNNLLETTAIPQQRPGNALVTNIPEHSKGRTAETFYDIDCTRSTKIVKNRQITNRREN